MPETETIFQTELKANTVTKSNCKKFKCSSFPFSESIHRSFPPPTLPEVCLQQFNRAGPVEPVYDHLYWV